jgi:hypothetical protein
MSDKKPDDQESPLSITQSMIDSPGGIQAGGNVTVHQAPPGRQITPPQAEQLRNALRAIPKVPLVIQSLMLDSETQRLAEQLKVIFADAGWQLSRFLIHIPNAPQPAFGIEVLQNSPKPKPLTVAVFEALKAIGLVCTPAFDRKLSDNELWINIGTNP